MFDYSKAAFDKIKTDFQRFVYRFTIASQILYIAYLIYMLCAPLGMLWANITLLAISVAYFTIFMIATVPSLATKMKKFKSISQNVYTRTKLLIKFFTLGITLYGISATTAHVTPFSIILTTLSILAWVLQLLFHIVLIFFIDRFHLLKEAFEVDVQAIKARIPFMKKDIEDEDAKEKSKHRLWLDEKVAEKRALKAQEKLQEKADKKQAKKQAKLDKKQEKLDRKQEKLVLKTGAQSALPENKEEKKTKKGGQL